MSSELVIRLARTGPAAWLSHLDCARSLYRALRRAGLRPAMSQGFHPQPLVRFARALPLGVASLDEAVLIRFDGDVPLQEAARSLDENLPQGLSLRTAVVLPGPLKSLRPLRARYRVALQGEEAAKCCRAAATSLPGVVVRKRDKRGGFRDVPVTEHLEGEPQGDGDGLVFTLSFRDGATLKALDAAEAALDAAGCPGCRIESVTCERLDTEPEAR